MDSQTKAFVYRVFGGTIALIMLGFAAVSIKIMWSDGNTALVSSISNNVTLLLSALVLSIGGVLVGQDITQKLASRSITTVTTQPINMITPVATVTQQKASEDVTPP